VTQVYYTTATVSANSTYCYAELVAACHRLLLNKPIPREVREGCLAELADGIPANGHHLRLSVYRPCSTYSNCVDMDLIWTKINLHHSVRMLTNGRTVERVLAWQRNVFFVLALFPSATPPLHPREWLREQRQP